MDNILYNNTHNVEVSAAPMLFLVGETSGVNSHNNTSIIHRD